MGWKKTIRLETTERMTIKFLSDIKLNDEARNQKIIKDYWTALCIMSQQNPKFLEMQLLDIVTSQNVAGLSILKSKNDPGNFRLI